MAHGPDWSSDSEDSLLGDDGDYINFKKHLRYNNTISQTTELTEEQKLKQELSYFYSALLSGSLESINEFLAKELVNSDLQGGWTPIMLAASYGNPDITKILLEAGADVNQNRESVTPLMMACGCPDSTSPFEKSFKVVQLLVEHGADVLAINRKRMDALMYAACNGNLEVVEYLLPMANKKASDNQRWNALTWAVSNNQLEIVDFLIKNDFEMDLVDVRGDKPLNIARHLGLDDIVKLFPKNDSDIVAEILGRPRLSFEETFSTLQTGAKPAFFEDICSILISVNCSHLIPLFAEKNVCLGNFLAMGDADLKEIGVLLPYQRNRILTGLYRFHKQPYHPKSLHVCVKNESLSNVDVAKELVSAVKQLIAMEASVRYLLKHLEKQELSKEDEELVVRNIKSIKSKIIGLKVIVGKMDKKFKLWDSLAIPVDLITSRSIKSHIPWKKVTLSLGICGLFILCKFKHILK